MSRVWKIVRVGSPEPWEDIFPENQDVNGALVRLLSSLVISHCPPMASKRGVMPHTTSLRQKTDRDGTRHLIMQASGSPIHYVATLEKASGKP